MDMEFLARFIPRSELAVIRGALDEYRDELDRVEREIRATPEPEAILQAAPEKIKIGMHYFGGSTDIWLYALEKNLEYAEGFVRLNGDSWNAEIGPVYIPELLDIPMMNLDLHWNTNTTLKEIMDRVDKANR